MHFNVYFKKIGLSDLHPQNTHTGPRNKRRSQHQPPPRPASRLGGSALRQVGQRLRQLSFGRNCEWEMPGAQELPLQHREASGRSGALGVASSVPWHLSALGSEFTSSQGAPAAPPGHKAPRVVTMFTIHLVTRPHREPARQGAGILLSTSYGLPLACSR